jgi:hypothetical protein
MKKVLWFSRHKMNVSQYNDLCDLYGIIDVEQDNRTIQCVDELKEQIEKNDIICVVLPIHLQMKLLDITKCKPVLVCRNHRIKKEDGGFDFVHAGWDRIEKIEIVKTILTNHPSPDNGYRRE